MLPVILEYENIKERDAYIRTFIEEHKIAPHNLFTYEPEAKELTIRQIREIIQETTFHASEPRLFLIHNFDSASIEAQNAFLKTLEEHQQKLYFILTVENVHRLLPTIRSRSKIVKKTATQPSQLKQERKLLIEAIEKGNAPPIFKIGNDIGKSETVEFLDTLISYYRTRLVSDLYAPGILQEIITHRNLFNHNHVDAQTAIDSVLIAIYKRHRTPKA